MTNKKYLIVLSGGLDSVTTLNVYVKKYGKENVKAISFDFHSKDSKTFNNNNVEIKCAKYHAKLLDVEHFIVDVSYMNKMLDYLREKTTDLTHVEGEKPKTAMPFRNLQLLSIASAYAEMNDIDYVVTGFQKQDAYGYWDTSNEFKNNFNKLISLNPTKLVQLESPFINDSKAEEIKKGLELGIDYSTTWTCYCPIFKDKEVYPCKECPSCVDRISNFKKLNMEDPVLKGLSKKVLEGDK